MASIFGEAVSPAADASAAQWIAPLLHSFGADVGAIIPPHFDRYLRIADAPPGQDDDRSAPGGILETIAVTARAHTATPEVTWYCIWEGYGWQTTAKLVYSAPAGRGTPLTALRRRRETRALRVGDDRRRRVLEGHLAQVPQLHLPHRAYYVLRGPVGAAPLIRDPGSPQQPQPPDLWWPDDRAWFVATDTDLSWLYVGGTVDLTDELMSALPDRATTVRATDPIQ